MLISMKMGIIGIFAIIAVFAGTAIYAYAKTSALPRVKTITVGTTAFSVEVADTLALRAKGLSGHAPLGAKNGMLFVFKSPSGGAFWMQGMLFPLDFVWIRNGAVVGVTENARPMSETGYQLYYPPVPVTNVLEINAGAVKKFGIRTGDKVK